MYTYNEIINMLENNVLEVVFTKTNGEIRVMNCTRKPNLVHTGVNFQVGATSTVIPVFDLDIQEVRSFNINSIRTIRVLKNYIAAPSTNRRVTVNTPQYVGIAGDYDMSNLASYTPNYVSVKSPPSVSSVTSKNDTNSYWGYHLILDCGKCDIHKITSYGNIHTFAKQLVKDIDMVAYGEPQIVKFGHSGKEGYTLVQLIETSNICAHFVDIDGSLYLDVFSCKTFDQNVVENLVKTYFGPKTIRKTYLTRQA